MTSAEELLREQEHLLSPGETERRRREAQRLLKKARPADPSLVEEVGREREDLAPILERVPVYTVPKRLLRPLRGWHYWEIENGRPTTRAIFLASDAENRGTLIHEACHSKVMGKYPEIYPYLSEQSKEILAALCERKKL
jgi:hypothetical protein